jgi:LPPG:FO 2-phospho-L-lactate transferase
MLTVLSGGVGAARLLRGLCLVVDPATVTAVVNVGDDIVLHGLRISPDLDTVTYTLAGLDNDVTGWGLVDESWRVMGELGQLGGPVWFSLGDRDLATHLYRTGRLDDGASLSEVTSELRRARGIDVEILPVTDQRLSTILTTPTGERLGFQEYFVARRHAVEVASISFDGSDACEPAPGVLEAIDTADRVVIAPSNPLVSIDPILAVPTVREHVHARRADVVAVSPIIGGAALKGPADRLLRETGHEVSALGVARLYRDLAAAIIIDSVDAGLRDDIEAIGLRCIVADTVMRDPARAASLAKVVLDG